MTSGQCMTSPRARQPGTCGLWVFVCGPSGAGKDSVLGWAAKALAERQDIVFARRLVTRAAQPGSDHDEVSPEQFARLIDGDGLAWRWQAHGFHYGIESRYAALVAAGRVVVVNGSREHVNSTRMVAGQLRVVHIEVDAVQLAARLAQRSRDTPEEVAHAFGSQRTLFQPACRLHHRQPT